MHDEIRQLFGGALADGIMIYSIAGSQLELRFCGLFTKQKQ